MFLSGIFISSWGWLGRVECDPKEYRSILLSLCKIPLFLHIISLVTNDWGLPVFMWYRIKFWVWHLRLIFPPCLPGLNTRDAFLDTRANSQTSVSYCSRPPLHANSPVCSDLQGLGRRVEGWPRGWVAEELSESCRPWRDSVQVCV